jgi:hypothetical protein
MSENNTQGESTYHIGFIIDDVVEQILQCDPRMAAILMSNPKIIIIDKNLRIEIGSKFDHETQRFKRPAPFPSWVWNEEMYDWTSPVPNPPDDGKTYTWSELSLSWIEIPENNESNNI